ncbi:MAG: hypothetical protein ABSG59_04635 [Verrucomicrobiota bacterium]|jgi:hypothetical protein
MKPFTPILLFLLLTGGSLRTAAQATNSETGPDLKEYDIIARKNIFDTTRTGIRGVGRRQPRVERIIFDGAVIDDGQAAAIFEGPGVPSRPLKTGEVLDGMTVTRITLDSVWLTNASSNTFVLNMNNTPSLRREENGPWQTSTDVSVPAPAATGTDDPSSASSPSGPSRPGESDVEKRMRLRREQEEK